MRHDFIRRACPGLSAPMQTGDGLLARFLPAAPIALDAFIAVCDAAREHGNGTIEISARGSVQIRGLTPISAPRFAQEVASLQIDICTSVQIIADPLPGDPLTLVDTGPVATAILRTIAERQLELAPKVSVVIDGGGRIDLGALFADIRLRALAAGAAPKFQLALAGTADDATPLGTVCADAAAGAVLDLLTRIAALGPEARAADLLPLPPAPSAEPERTERVDPVGVHPLGDAVALGIGLGFGHTRAEALAELAVAAGRSGAAWARPAPGRALLLGPLCADGLADVRRTAEGLEFVAEASDPRRKIAACPGAPACRHGLIAARALAAEIARDVTLPAGDGIVLHVSGCAKGCAHPHPAPLTLVGTEQGCGLVRGGTARTAPNEHVTASEVGFVLAEEREAVHA